MKIIIPQEVKEAVKSLGNKTIQNSAYKVYYGLLNKNKYKNKFGFFSCPSAYLKALHNRYNVVINRFLERGIIEYFKGLREDPNDIFAPAIRTKYYNTNTGVCMRYRFLIDVKQGELIEFNFDTKYERWYEIVKSSLLQLGYEVKIKRDDFGLRVHHPAIYDYKTELKDKGFSVIDAKASQPKLLYHLMKRRKVVDKNYYSVFESGVDFYLYLVKHLKLKDRNEAKELFMFWVNSNGYVPKYKIKELFPEASEFLRKLKIGNYKDSARFLQREEAKIWIDDLLNNIPVGFALPVHDCLIVRQCDVIDVLEYCKSKYPEIDFDDGDL